MYQRPSTFLTIEFNGKRGIFFENLWKQTIKNTGYCAYGVNFLLEMFYLKFNRLKFLMYFLTNSSLSFFSFKFKRFLFQIKFDKNVKKTNLHINQALLNLAFSENNFEFLVKIDIFMKLLKRSFFNKIFTSKGFYSVTTRNFFLKGLDFLSLFNKKINLNSLEYPLYIIHSTDFIFIWDITSKRIIFQLFCPRMLISDDLIPKKTKKILKLFSQHKMMLINFKTFIKKNETDYPHLIILKKKLTKDYLLNYEKYKDFFKIPFSFTFFTPQKFGIDIWEKNFQENWDTFDSNFKQINISKKKKSHVKYFSNGKTNIF